MSDPQLECANRLLRALLHDVSATAGGTLAGVARSLLTSAPRAEG